MAASLLDGVFEALAGVEHGAVLVQEPGMDGPQMLAQRGTSVGVTSDGGEAGAIDTSMVQQVMGEALSIGATITDQGPHAAYCLAAPLVGEDGDALGLIHLTRRSATWGESELE